MPTAKGRIAGSNLGEISVGLFSTMPFPEYAIGVALDGRILVGKEEAFGSKEAVVEVEFDATIAAT